MAIRPGGEFASRPLHFIWIADCSGSMGARGKIQALNNAIREAIPHMREVADKNPQARILVRAISFSSGARWHISKETPVEDFKWRDLSAGGVTDMGKAFSMVADQLKIPPMTDRALPPVLVLISDGQPTDDWRGGLQKIRDLPWGKKAVRVAIAIGDDAEDDMLEAFIDNPELPPLRANNPEALTGYIRWVSTAVVDATSSPASQAPGTGQLTGPVPVPVLPDSEPKKPTDVW